MKKILELESVWQKDRLYLELIEAYQGLEHNYDLRGELYNDATERIQCLVKDLIAAKKEIQTLKENLGAAVFEIKARDEMLANLEKQVEKFISEGRL